MKYETVDALFTATCDAIRTQDGTTDPIAHQDIPDRILAISSEGGGVSADGFTFTEIDFDAKNLANWIQVNSNVTYQHSYVNGLNKFENYKGGSAYERWTKQLPALELDTLYAFVFSMWSPTGFTYGHYSGSWDCAAVVFPYKPNDPNYNLSRGYTNPIAYINLDPSQASNEKQMYCLFFQPNSTNNSSVRWISIETGNITDGLSCEIDIADIALYKVEINKAPAPPPIEKYWIYKSGAELNGHIMTIHGTSNSQKTAGWIFMHYYYSQKLTSDLIKRESYSKIGITILCDATVFNHSVRATTLYLRDTDAIKKSGNDWVLDGGTIYAQYDIVLYPNTLTRLSGTFTFDLPKGVEEFYVTLSNVNVNTYIEELWLE